ncbi:hypothetical protein Hanom_Chr01g00092081 [Helianthus anomalus]
MKSFPSLILFQIKNLDVTQSSTFSNIAIRIPLGVCRLWIFFFNRDQVLMIVRRRTLAATGVSLNSNRSRIYFTNLCLDFDLPKLNRYPSRVLYVSGNALESCLRSENYVTIKPLIYVTCHSPADIQPLLASYHDHDITTEFFERFKEHQR